MNEEVLKTRARAQLRLLLLYSFSIKLREKFGLSNERMSITTVYLTASSEQHINLI